MRSLEDFPPESFFEHIETFPALLVPVQRTAELRRQLKHVLLQRRRTAHVQIPTKQSQPVNDTAAIADPKKHRILILANEQALQDDRVQELLSRSDSQTSDEAETCRETTFSLKQTYQDLTVEQVLKRLLTISESKESNDEQTKPVEASSTIVASSNLPDDNSATTTNNTNTIMELPGSSFELVGSVAHVNLQDTWLPFKYWIGKVILDKNQPTIRTVVNKLGNIANEYRVLDMEIIAGYNGDDWSLVTVKEEGCRFALDFQKVYWNSRLAGEHKRIVQLLQQQAAALAAAATTADSAKDTGDASLWDHSLVIADLMAGVGPFAIPLTAQTASSHATSSSSSSSSSSSTIPKRPVTRQTKSRAAMIRVYANDLNPSSYHYLQRNAVLNKCSPSLLQTFNMDARAMVHKLQDDRIPVDYFIMNLPKSAPEFLDAFRGYQMDWDATASSTNGEDSTNPPITASQQQKEQQQQQHQRPQRRPRLLVHCFAPKASTESSYPDAVERCAQALGCPLDVSRDNVVVRTVRNVAPNKNMVCVSFDLPQAVSQLPRIKLSHPITETRITETINADHGIVTKKSDAITVQGEENGAQAGAALTNDNSSRTNVNAKDGGRDETTSSSFMQQDNIKRQKIN